MRFPGRHYIYILAVGAVWVWGCAPASMPFDVRVPAQALSYVGAPPVVDARVRFRAIFCELVDMDPPPFGSAEECESLLWRLNDEPRAPATPVNLPQHDPSLTILIVPGAFSDCFGEIGETYPESVVRLREVGYRIETVPISGLSSSPYNAKIIAEAVGGLARSPLRKLVLFGYSKGTTDILHFLVAYPDLALRVDAVLSVAGAVNGSPLADRYSEAEYDNWLTDLFPGDCPSGDRGVLDSLSRTRQFPWLAAHPLPGHVRYFSLAAFARYANVQHYLRPTYNLLKRIHPLNDGQLLFMDQLIPGSALLGYVNADHWTVAIPAEETFSKRDPALLERNRRMRDLLFEAMILLLSERLNAPR